MGLQGLTLHCVDLMQHFPYINKFKGKLSAGGFNLSEDPDKQLMMEMAVKCGDLSNPIKPYDIARKWTGRVMEEFFRQVFQLK
jgi:3'5'-cyclic nucleotide phosphodiesterase